MHQHCNFINGKWCPPASGRWYMIYNPARQQDALGEFPKSSAVDVASAIGAATAAAQEWSAVPGPQRAGILLRFADLLECHKQDLGRIVTLEMGKPLGEATGEVGRAAVEARFAAGEASRLEGRTFPSERPGFSCSTVLEPLGVVAAISPWNFPVVTPVRKIAPALACGNAVVFKPASATPWSAMYVTMLWEQAGIPAGVLNLVIGQGGDIGDALVDDPRVGGITFTGSSGVGIRLYERAARRMAKVQLELGGKNPAVVIEYDDLDGAAREIVSAAFACSGQRCTAISRVIVAEDLAADLTARILNCVGEIRVGDGLEPGVTMGPLVNRRQLEAVAGYVEQAIAAGSRLEAGGHPLTDGPAGDGCFYAPTVFIGVAADSPLARDEIFGPVLPIISVRSIGEAIEVANDTSYGLAAALFTNRMPYIEAFIREVRAGMVHVNHGTASQAHVPFGGVKNSGQGAYSIGHTAKDFYTNLKTIYFRWT